MNSHKNFIIKAALCCLILGMMWSIGMPRAAAHSFPGGGLSLDGNLNTAINEQYGFTAPFSQAEMNQITSLNATGRGIQSIEHLDHATNLTRLYLADNSITDLGTGTTPYLPAGLTHLNLAGNTISVLGSGTTSYFPAGLTTSLTHLSLSRNSLTDTLTTVDPDPGTPGDEYLQGPADSAAVLRHLSALTDLEVLNVSHNSIVNITAVESLTDLTDLVINNNKISDFSALLRNSENSGLGTGDEVWLGANNFGASVQASISELDLRDQETNQLLTNQMVIDQLGLDILVYYPGFYESYASFLMRKGVTLYSTLGEIADVPNPDLRALLRGALVVLFRTADRQSDWPRELNKAIAEVTTSGEFINNTGDTARLSANQLLARYAGEPLTIPVLRRIRALNASNTSGYYLQNLDGLDNCSNLEVLDLEGAEFHSSKSYEVVGRLTNLRVLNLSYQFPYDSGEDDVEFDHSLKHLGNLKKLRWLDLRGNSLKNLEYLAGLTALERLDLRTNDIQTYQYLENLTNLQMLYLHGQDLYLAQINAPDGSELRRGKVVRQKLDLPFFHPLRTLASRIQHPWVTDTVIVKDYGFALEPPLAYSAGSNIIIEVTFQGLISSDPPLTADPNPHQTRPYLLLDFGNDVGGRAEWIAQTYVAEENATKVEFAYPVHSEDREGELTIENLGLVIPESGALVHWRPLDNSIFPQGESVFEFTTEYLDEVRRRFEAQYADDERDPPTVTGRGGVSPATNGDVVENQPYPVRSLPYHHFVYNLPLQSEQPIIQTPPTVQMSRAGGETGTATGEKFDVEITFSAPLDGPSAAALASKISLEEDVVGVTIGAPTRPSEPTAYEPETWTLSVSVAKGVSGDVTVTLDPEGLTDLAFPGNPYASAGSTLSITVPVNRPGESVPDTEPVSVGSSLEFSIVFEEDGVTYEGTEKPYITIYVGEQEQANERHAVWARERDVNSTEVTFEYQVGAGDIASEVSLKPEEGIAIPRGTTFVSETVRIVGKDLPASGPGEAPPPPTQQSGGGGPDPGQPAAGSPPITTAAERTRVSLTTAFARPTVLKRSVQILGIVYLPPETEETKADASGVPRSPVVFNELGNGSGDSNDWLEFRNVTGAAVSLKDWELSVVQNGEKKDTSLIVFPDVSVPANGLLLITNSDPTADGNLLAGGDNVATSAVETKGSSHLYLVNSGLALPDDGKFLLILRKSKEKLGKDEAFVDVAGGGGSDTDAFIREQAGEYDTHVWPLQVREAPGADTEDALGSGKVWQRAKADIVGYHKDAWAEAAFTGIGYDRAVSKSAATAGTPGYPNGALKTEASTPKGSITISEVMFDSGGGKLPQWVELYNKSKTEAINLNRWRLELQNVNSEDLVGRPIVTLTLGEKVIQPNQTLLIVSGDARASASARLPADRVYNLFKLHEKNLRIKKQHDTFLSAVGFYLKLSDRNGTKIDEVGNTDGNRRTDDAPSWAFPVSPEEGVRSSLIRRYTKGTSVAEDGMERGGWVLASNVKRFVADKELHWGHADDIGTPGYRAGGPLPVELSSFSVKRTEAGAVVLTWTTESEVDNAGFNLRRSEKRDSGFTLLNPALIAGAGTTGERQAYTWTDTSAKPGVEYYYRIEEVAFDGGPVTLVTRFLPGPVSASNRMLTTFGAVKSRD